MKSSRISSGALGTPGQWNSLHDDAAAGSALLAHQQLGYFSLGTNPSNGQVINLVVNGNTIPLTAVTSLTGASAGSFVIGSNPLANLISLIQNPWLTNSSQVALSLPNQELLLYLGYSLSGTTLTIYSQNTSLNTQLTSFTGSTTFTSGSYTANTMALYVEPGGYYIGAARVFFAGGSTPTFTAPVSHPRIDLVTINSSGVVALVTGTENASPSAPAFPTGVIVICEVYHVVGETAIYDFSNQASGQGYISADTRPVVNTPASATAPFSISEVGVYTVSPDPITQSQTITVNFSYTGSGYASWLCPSGITSITITLNGAQGENGGNTSVGGLGGQIVGTFTVTPGTTYYINVGGQNGYNGGGTGGGFNGGGMTWFSTANSFAQASVVLVAAGGGGASVNQSGTNGGEGGGTTGSTGATGSGGGTGGGGGSQSAGGTGGTANSGGTAGGTGTAGQGGNGGYNGVAIEAGSGGGGYYGGGGGGGGSAGGGGSSYAKSGVTSVTNTGGGASSGGNGSATIQYTATASSTPVIAGNDSVGTITIPSTGSPFAEITGVTLTVTFANTFPNIPFVAAINATIVSISTTELVLTVSTNTTVQFLCISYK